MASEKRQQRVAEQIRKELGRILLRRHGELAAGLTVSEVRLSSDLSHARVFVSAMGAPAERAERLKRLHAVQRELRRELAGALRLRAVPLLRFLPDESLDRVDAVERLLAEIRAEQGAETSPDEADDAAGPADAGSLEADEPCGEEGFGDEDFGAALDDGADDPDDAGGPGAPRP